MTRYIIAGPPCAGKSTYVLERASPGDIVVDFDVLHQAIAALPVYEHHDRVRPYVFAARDAIIDRLAKVPAQPAWVISSSPSAAEVARLAELLNAEIVTLYIDRETAHGRAAAAGRPSVWHEYIDRWFDTTDIEAKGLPHPSVMAAIVELELLEGR